MVDIPIQDYTIRNDYEAIAAYFADVLAASAYDLLSKKSTSKTERRRQLSICTTALESLRAQRLIKARPSIRSNVMKRLEDILAKFNSESTHD